jgi:hypothetical protein
MVNTINLEGTTDAPAPSEEKLLFENEWCKLYSVDTHYVLKSKSKKYNDQFYGTLDGVSKATGIPKNRLLKGD